MKVIKKMCNIFLSLILIVCCLVVPTQSAEAKTLGDLKEELNKKIEEYEASQNEKDLTEGQINSIKNSVNSIHQEIDQNQKTVVELENQILELEADIAEREAEIKEIVRYYQLSQGESMYLEYAFGAADFTDFIYRLAISEQLSKYNQELVQKQNKMIEDNQKKQQELVAKETELLKKQEELNAQLNSLGNKLSEIVDLTVDIEEEIKTQREAIQLYEREYNCKDSDELSVCTANKLPADTSFWRPMEKGRRTSEYGYRTYTLHGETVSDFHTGIDLSTSPKNNVAIYAAAAGKVVGIVERASCGGNKIYINHTINGKKYTTAYVHLRKIMVSVGDTVTKDMQIGVMGGDPSIEYWDRCSTGAHLHFIIATGWYLNEYYSWNTFVSKTMNPRNIVNFPSGGNYFYNRTTKY